MSTLWDKQEEASEQRRKEQGPRFKELWGYRVGSRSYKSMQVNPTECQIKAAVLAWIGSPQLLLAHARHNHRFSWVIAELQGTTGTGEKGPEQSKNQAESLSDR